MGSAQGARGWLGEQEDRDRWLLRDAARDTEDPSLRRSDASRSVGARIARLPFPYRAMLAISTDLDGTRTSDEYFELLRFWNSTAKTSLGPGLGLQLANSLYFAMTPRQFSYWNASSDARTLLRTCNRSGLIDTLHSFGELATDRASIDACLDEIDRHSMRFPVWSNHFHAVSNFRSSPRSRRAAGDDEDSTLYHAKRTLSAGVRYAVLGQVSGILGQEVRANPLRHVERLKDGARSAALQALKVIASPISRRYRAHATNRVLNPARLMDGQPIFEVLRTNWHTRGIGYGSTGRVIHELLNAESIRRLSRSGGVAVVYSHLGQCFRLSAAERRRQSEALLEMRHALAKHRVIVMTTSDLLDHLLLTQYLDLRVSTSGQDVSVNLLTDRIPLRGECPRSAITRSGLTILVRSPSRPRLTIDGRKPDARLTCTRVGEGTWRMCMPLRRRRLPPSLS